MAIKKVSDTRLNKINARRTLANTIERASDFCISYHTALGTGVATTVMGHAIHDCEYIGGYTYNTAAANVNNGIFKIKKSSNDDLSSPTDISAEITMASAAADAYAITAATNTISAGDAILFVISDALAGDTLSATTLYFKTVDNVDNSQK